MLATWILDQLQFSFQALDSEASIGKMLHPKIDFWPSPRMMGFAIERGKDGNNALLAHLRNIPCFES